MSEVIKDCSIKLFGKTITFPPEESVSDITLPERRQDSSATSISSQEIKDPSDTEMVDSEHENDSINLMEETLSNNDSDSKAEEHDQSKKDSSPPNSPDEEEEPSESSISQEKELKKPDKILSCPRCTSKDTKFCYFNNYNSNQPRHFCKNCQRYWTAGGTMRNVPVGSGRRKNKNSSSVRNYGHLMVPDMFKATQANSLNGVQFSPFNPNGFFIFGSDGRTDSMNHDLCEQPNRSSTETSSTIGKGQISDPKQGPGLQVFHGMPPPGLGLGLGYSQAPWPYQCSSSGFSPSGVPVTFYPSTTYWRCAVPNSWNGTCISPTSSSGPSDICTSTTSNLGKHFREGTTMPGSSNLGKANPTNKTSTQKSVSIPKTLRIDDPSEAAKSSIWSTLGSKNKKISLVNGTSLFKAFESKGDRNRNLSNSMMVMRANPAALSRSLKFHESA